MPECRELSVHSTPVMPFHERILYRAALRDGDLLLALEILNLSIARGFCIPGRLLDPARLYAHYYRRELR
jgi:hypothetical protein